MRGWNDSLQSQETAVRGKNEHRATRRKPTCLFFSVGWWFFWRNHVQKQPWRCRSRPSLGAVLWHRAETGAAAGRPGAAAGRGPAASPAAPAGPTRAQRGAQGPPGSARPGNMLHRSLLWPLQRPRESDASSLIC